jgi:hypothetical protein
MRFLSRRVFFPKFSGLGNDTSFIRAAQKVQPNNSRSHTAFPMDFANLFYCARGCGDSQQILIERRAKVEDFSP